MICRFITYYDVGVKRWLKKIRLVSMHKHLGHALAQSSLAAVLRALKTSAQVPGTQHLLRSYAMVLRLFVHADETQSLFLAFDLYIILSNKVSYKKAAGQADYSAQKSLLLIARPAPALFRS